MRLIGLILSLTALFCTGLVFAEPTNSHFSLSKQDDYKAMAKMQQLTLQELQWELAPIKSRADLLTYSVKGSTPLDKLSTLSKQRFIDSVTFNEKGVTGFYYKDLELELTKSEIYSILSELGAQFMMPLFKNARVETKADELISVYSSNLGIGDVTFPPKFSP